jgi:hypothetical protein
MIGILTVSVIGLSLIGTAVADDLPRIGYSEGTPVKDWQQRGTAGLRLMGRTRVLPNLKCKKSQAVVVTW